MSAGMNDVITEILQFYKHVHNLNHLMNPADLMYFYPADFFLIVLMIQALPYLDYRLKKLTDLTLLSFTRNLPEEDKYPLPQ
jgi:hypothetical protein